MMLIGKKVGMTQIYDETGKILPVTVILAGPCTVMQVKTVETDGYNAVQIGFDDVKASRLIKAEEGHAKKVNASAKRCVREDKFDGKEAPYQAGDTVTVEAFAEVKYVDVTGTSKGKGFAGGMKRHGFGGMPASHGTERKHRSPGSIAGHAANRGWGGKPAKGKRMAGHMGDVKVTSKNHALVSVDAEKNIIVVKGAVPGPAGGYVIVKQSKGKK
ncbi:MAG: 50S ribosomal protein L3 [Planctomycetes bacterium GWF2_41_51]|nr:MAG: 50S ribosomal protein L3 [Planctomycetes bacterium GWF2_41_51]